MKTETEIKIILKDVNIEKLITTIEKVLDLKKSPVFHQTTHQFFLEDYTKQFSFPRIRNEEDGRNTLTVKIKGQDSEKMKYFKRTELETEISDIEAVINMMLCFGYTKRISWEKKRMSFVPKKDFEICLDETPMGYFLEIEAEEKKIEEVIRKLGLEHLERSKKAYLGLWADYREGKNIDCEDMLF
jgi:adenylate cyclase class 2